MADTKFAVVTGASSGIGYELAKELVSNGYVVYAAARRTAPIEALQEKYGADKLIPVQLDVSDPEQLVRFRHRLQAELPAGKLHALFNNAGQSCTMPATDVTNDSIAACMNVNFIGPANLTRELVPYLINAKGTVLFTGSVAGIVPFPFGSVYSASKAALHQYARVLHLELKPFGVRVLNVITGGVASNIEDTRPLPETSLYNTPEGREAFATRQRLASKNNPTPAHIYAKQLVADLQSSADPVDIYRGHLASFLRIIMAYTPYSFIEWGLAKFMHLFPFFDAIQAQNSTKNK